MRGINSVTIVGNVGRDPEVRFTQSGTAVANINVATSDTWFDKNTKQKQERTEWHRVVAWGKLAEIVKEYVEKGRQIYVQGRIETRAWEDKQGNKKHTTEIVAKEILLLGSRGGKKELAQEIFNGSVSSEGEGFDLDEANSMDVPF